MFSSSVSFGYAVLGNYKSLAVNMSDEYLNLVIGNLGAFSNGGFRFIFGLSYDKFKFFNVYKLMLIINIILCFTFIFIVDNKFLFAFYVVLAAAIEGGHFTIFAPFVIEKFGI